MHFINTAILFIPFESIARERILTIFIQLEDRKGSLATLLQIVSDSKCNVLTIHQTIPVQARANITLSLDVTEMINKNGRVPATAEST